MQLFCFFYNKFSWYTILRKSWLYLTSTTTALTRNKPRTIISIIIITSCVCVVENSFSFLLLLLLCLCFAIEYGTWKGVSNIRNNHAVILQ